MKNFDSRTYSVSDFIEWRDKRQLELSPKFQRKSVWSDDARSFLMDTIIRGKPIPKIFMRQTINPVTKTSTREVVDGQQRLRTILGYVHDEFTISKKHNQRFGGLKFSELITVDDSIQTELLSYEIAVDLLVNLPDAEILDIFSRLNSYAVTLNEQEKINANHFGEFKLLADKLAFEHNGFWTTNRILNTNQIVRMLDVQLTADLLVAMTKGISSKKALRNFYRDFEKNFPYQTQLLEQNFDWTLSYINQVFMGSGLMHSEFSRIHLFYTLFTSIYHLKFGISNIKKVSTGWRPQLDKYDFVANKLSRVDYIFANESNFAVGSPEFGFLTDTRRATTDAAVRIRRTEFITGLLV